jgi:hypothetical protein
MFSVAISIYPFPFPLEVRYSMSVKFIGFFPGADASKFGGDMVMDYLSGARNLTRRCKDRGVNAAIPVGPNQLAETATHWPRMAVLTRGVMGGSLFGSEKLTSKFQARVGGL